MPVRLTYLFATVILVGALIHPAIGHAATRGIDVTLKASEAPASSGGTNMEALFWRSIQAGGDIESHEAYLSRYPKGTFAAPARVRINKLKQQKQLAAAAPPKPKAPSPAEPAAKKAGQVFRDCPDCPEMVVIPAGSFRMGDIDGGAKDNDEKPVHPVTIPKAFAVGKYVVTFAEWKVCVADGGCGGHRPNDRGWGRGKRPVINVSWEDAKAYVSWLGIKTGKRYRLLTEAEWEYAARANTTTKYHFGNSISSVQANYGVNHGRTVPVGEYPANGFGLHDMHGNVWEWVEDCYHSSYSAAPSNGNAWTSGGDCRKRVIRGGSWDVSPRKLRSADRVTYSLDSRLDYIGFRIARTLP